ncbi:hypothetical protein [Sphingopyxis sp. GW247-27LB]|uniref:hypothetical protein n=1 Tax=Sphingopyxis sp. GW247-27LB TaxID=2012632 RepID=UPI000BA6B61B|nr:hypothetical protein [Sphingopyxis sp. GW247-27LB]PAL20227.1 hypothetical protein CD928_17625 [Sphingopyxis sp. GW247-27LB]
MAEALGEALLYLRTDDRGLDAGIAKAKGKSDQLGVAFDTTSGKADQLGQSMDRAGASAERFGNSQAAVSKMSNAQRAGMQQLSMQISDVATMYSLGARPMQIFASQIGQITQAVQRASGGTSKFAAFMGSPWTMAMSTAAIVLVPLIGNLLDSEDAADKAGKANQTWTDKLDASKHSIDEVRAALREYNAEQKKANETTLEAAAAASAAAAAKLKEALALRQALAAQLASINEDTLSARGAGGEGAGTAMAAGRSVMQSRIAENEAAITELTQQARDAASSVAEEMAKLETDTTAKIKFEAEQRRKAVRDEIATYDEKLKKLKEINRWEKSETEKANAAKRSGGASGAASRAASVGDMTALIKMLFGAGSQITSTTGGRHVKGSDHYAGRAIDFIPEGGMGRYSTAEVQKILEDAGVSIRRNAKGTQQLFGPGRSASSQGDHDDHFHFAWSGSASPEEAQRRAAQAAERAARAAEQEERRKERYSRDLAGLQDAQADLQAQLGQTAEERYQLERQGLEIATAEHKRRIDANSDYDDAEKATLRAELEKKASLERELLDRRRREELAKQALQIAQAMNASEAELLDKQMRLAETREGRRAIDQQLLDIAYRDRKAALEARINDTTASDGDRWSAFVDLSNLEKSRALDQEQLNRNYESPLERYRREVAGVGNNINDELESVAVNGLDRLSDGLTDVIMGAKSLGDMFKQVAKQIIAELLRIAIQQMVIMPLLNALGGGGGGGFGGGGGGGGGLLSSVFAGMFADGGLIPNGSFGIVGEAGPEPVFATPGGVGVMPNSALRKMGGGGEAGPMYFDLRGAVMTADLLRQMNAMSQANVRSGLAEYDRGVGARVQDNMARRG